MEYYIEFANRLEVCSIIITLESYLFTDDSKDQVRYGDYLMLIHAVVDSLTFISVSLLCLNVVNIVPRNALRYLVLDFIN